MAKNTIQTIKEKKYDFFPIKIPAFLFGTATFKGEDLRTSRYTNVNAISATMQHMKKVNNTI